MSFSCATGIFAAKFDKKCLVGSEESHYQDDSFPFKSQQMVIEGSVTIRGRHITYQAVAGTLIVHPKFKGIS
ncbi:hypothetical protein AA23498_2754 [Acetobacter nitrogenifigens DSM 23921 = NBRC 105050]|uniref:Uncharacterized protein n=1 Tax=Acetobacter nitrogenifigens DSM 23921 = NBRC 105050 TaxID=1120919 RepID=A0A511XDS4_9PROT|nr:hypothetical protein AA23498_2754 [Acetobacter nitrogenifigens DSM 23921 = NBRC 105050]GEN61097.1 hypothetical protein ANI02nite_29810 [Acetobacter nitrogenifigens DSM 23921 = NBRC 105050]